MVDEVAGKEAVGEGEVIVVVDKATVVEIEILEEISAMGDVAMVDAVIVITAEEVEDDVMEEVVVIIGTIIRHPNRLKYIHQILIKCILNVNSQHGIRYTNQIVIVKNCSKHFNNNDQMCQIIRL